MTTTLERDAEISARSTNAWPIRLLLPDQWMLDHDCLEALSSLNQDLRFERGCHGELEISMPAGGASSNIGLRIGAALMTWSDAGAAGMV